MKVPLIGIGRHRIGIDGEGVTTLVTFHGCPLHCQYCLNPHCLVPEGVWREMSPEEVLEEVRIDNLYFLATGGGITFGGGEPFLRSEFIQAFCELAPQEWKMTIESSLNVERKHLERLLPLIDSYIVDVKDMNPDIYEHYTGRENTRTIDNLHWLAEQGVAEKVLIRLPLIPDFNTQKDRENSRLLLEEMGYTRFDEFQYISDVRAYKESRHHTTHLHHE